MGTGSCFEFIDKDDSDHLPLYKKYCSDYNLKVRNNKDKVTDTRGNELTYVWVINSEF